VIRNEEEVGHAFLNIGERVSVSGEQGLLSIAFHPGYERNRLFYLYYTNNDGNIQVDRFKRSRRSSTRAPQRSRRKVIEIAHPPPTTHNGGTIQFGPDGKLWLAPGDGRSDGGRRAQHRGSLLGKLLRIDPKPERGYTVPNSNPYVGHPGRNEIWARGLRNPFRFTFDRQTGDVAIADVGAVAREEVNIRSRSRAKRGNFGWPICEGTICDGSPPNNYLGPTFEHERTEPHCSGPCSITGGYVVRANSIPALDGRYVYGDFFQGEIRSITPNGANDNFTGLDVGARLSSFGEGIRGRIYVTSLTGPVYRIVQD
jgi:glucose/arabinose dehydrogenase